MAQIPYLIDTLLANFEFFGNDADCISHFQAILFFNIM